MTKPIHILGAGGHAAVLISTLDAKGYKVAGVWDDDPGLTNTEILGVPILGAIHDLPSEFRGPAAVGIGNNTTRKAIVDQFPQCDWLTLVHPKAVVDPHASIGRGTVVFAGAIVQPRSTIGEHCILNTGCSVDHDCCLGDFCHLAPGARLAGMVTLDEGVFMGIGSSVIPQKTVGVWSTVGAGGVVIRDVPPGRTVVGVPAMPIRYRSSAQAE